MGSLTVKRDDERMANRSYLISADGAIVARYDKIHMFDVALKGGEAYRESAAYRPGERAVLAEAAGLRLGMTVCYDLRFPRLYRDLARAGAEVLAVPSAFTVPTGEAHWHVLLRARAIENGAYVLAPAQWGTHAAATGKPRRTYGHSLAVSPWGAVLADAEQKDEGSQLSGALDPRPHRAGGVQGDAEGRLAPGGRQRAGTRDGKGGP